MSKTIIKIKSENKTKIKIKKNKNIISKTMVKISKINAKHICESNFFFFFFFLALIFENFF